jgi:hypothetical protein
VVFTVPLSPFWSSQLSRHEINSVSISTYIDGLSISGGPQIWTVMDVHGPFENTPKLNSLTSESI